jgi:hypothetical protein
MSAYTHKSMKHRDKKRKSRRDETDSDTHEDPFDRYLDSINL